MHEKNEWLLLSEDDCLYRILLISHPYILEKPSRLLT